MKKLIYILLFFVFFIFFFLITFPADKVTAYYLNKFNINYKSVQGNLFNLKIEGIEYNQIIIPEVYIKPFLVGIKVIVPENNQISITPDKKLKILFTDLVLEDFQKKPFLYGNIKGKANIFIKKYITAEGKSNILVKNYIPLNIRNMKINLKMKQQENKTKIKLIINSSNISGTFNGYTKIPSENINNGIIEGNFNGKIFGSNTNQHIEVKIGKIFKNM